MIIASHDSICLPFFIISSSAYWCRGLNSLWKFISISFYFFMKTKCKFLVEEIKIDDKCFANSCFGKFIQEKNHHRRTHWRLDFRYKAKKKNQKKRTNGRINFRKKKKKKKKKKNRTTCFIFGFLLWALTTLYPFWRTSAVRRALQELSLLQQLIIRSFS